MKKIFPIFILLFGLISCDNGDIIVTSFDLEDSELSLCSLGNQKVLFVINNNGVHESMSLQLSSNSFSEDSRLLSRDTDQTIQIDLSGNNRMIYRLYDAEVPSDYFCQAIPPREPRVIDEYVTTEGQVLITTRFNDLAGNQDADRDGIANLEEGMDPNATEDPQNPSHQDTDGNGIPDFLDPDDDGDNVLTSTEIRTGGGVTSEGYPDTDEDGTPNYLDPDDDGDGVPTKYEVDENDPQNLTNPPAFVLGENGIPNYLNKEYTIEFVHDQTRDLSFNRNIRSDILIRDFKLVRQDGSGEEIRFDQYNLGTYLIANIAQEPQQPEEEEEEPPVQEN